MAFVYWIHLPEHTDINTEGYVGFTSKSVEVRFSQHRKDSNHSKYSHFPLYRAFSKYGSDLIIDTLVEGSSEYCLEVEKKLRPIESTGWNIKVGGEKPNLGCVVSTATREKIRNSLLGNSPTDDARMNMSLSQRGRMHPVAVKAKIGLSRSKWKHPLASPVWTQCPEIFNHFLKSTKPCEVMRIFNITRIVTDKLYKHFHNGWNPNEDQEYLSWLEEKKGKQCHMN